MFVRLARFEGADSETRNARAAQLEREIEAVKAGGSPEGAPARRGPARSD